MHPRGHRVALCIRRRARLQGRWRSSAAGAAPGSLGRRHRMRGVGPVPVRSCTSRRSRRVSSAQAHAAPPARSRHPLPLQSPCAYSEHIGTRVRTPTSWQCSDAPPSLYHTQTIGFANEQKNVENRCHHYDTIPHPSTIDISSAQNWFVQQIKFLSCENKPLKFEVELFD